MAQRINVQLVDDIDGNDAVETVSFALDGQQYEIDLSEENAANLRDALSLYVANGRRVTGSGRRRGASGGRTTGGSRSGSDGPSAADIRAWARENGFDVPDRGRVSAEVRDAYAAAH
ncbi:Lsr2 family protein [Microbacterium sp.]|uniref:histone-like nucleoid-structuring protein Lsr2 n=1 Tax=Microbacterium sp. TaxID=51671 RepID=UPI003735450F